MDEPDITKAEAKRRGPDYLFDDLAERLEREPVRMQLEVQIAGDGDDVDDPSSIWPAERERVIVGTLEITAIDSDADDSIVMDPMRLVDGIEPSGDPVLHYRPPVYDLSHRRRTAGVASRVRVGLVLGAGGVQGGAWLTGGLDALADHTGWDPATRRRSSSAPRPAR